jgi:hypothetical protein
MNKDINEPKEGIIYASNGTPMSLPIEITDGFRFTRRSMYEDEPKPPKKGLFSRIFKI